jgi:hypothetical protein
MIGKTNLIGSVLAGVEEEPLEKSAAGTNEHSETQPSWLRPTSVGFATSARAKCAFLVLQEFSRDFTALKNRVGTRQTAAFRR